MIKYYYLFLLFPLFTKCFSYIHLIDRTIASFEEKNIHAKLCKKCRFFIENENPDLSMCVKFMKSTNTNKENTVDVNSLELVNLATTCRNNETLCGFTGKHYERKFYDIY